MQIFLFGYSAVTNADDLIQQQRIAESPQWNGEKFQNPERVPATEWGESLTTFWDYFFNKPEEYTPSPPLPAEPFDISHWDGQRDLQFAWLGHTTFLIKIDDKVILTDPMFSQQAGTYGWFSPVRYSKTLASTDVLPVVDVVLITHNHSDHLDENSIKTLIPKTRHFIAPLAVGKLLEEWGVSRKKITELDSRFTVRNTGRFNSETNIPGVGKNYAFIQSAIYAEPNVILEPVKAGTGYFLIKVISKSPFDSTAYSMQSSTIRNNIIQQKKNTVVSQWLTALKEKSEIVDNRHLFYGY